VRRETKEPLHHHPDDSELAARAKENNTLPKQKIIMNPKYAPTPRSQVELRLWVGPEMRITELRGVAAGPGSL